MIRRSQRLREEVVNSPVTAVILGAMLALLLSTTMGCM